MAQENQDEGVISMVAALSANDSGIGRGGALLWRIPEDMARFKALTTSHPVIMGRKTWESLPERFRPLPDRTNIVVSRDSTYVAFGALVAHSLEDAILLAKSQSGSDEIFIIGGQEMYTLGLPHADRLYLTLIEATSPHAADSFFPPYADTFTTLASREDHLANPIPFSFVTLERA